MLLDHTETHIKLAQARKLLNELKNWFFFILHEFHYCPDSSSSNIWLINFPIFRIVKEMLARLAARRMGSLRQPLGELLTFFCFWDLKIIFSKFHSARQSVRKSTDMYACPEGTIVEGKFGFFLNF